MTRPYVLINAAVTADGKTDTIERRGAIISSSGDRERVDRLRAGCDAVMVGGRTLIGDDPRLTVRSDELRADRVSRGLTPNPAKVGVISRPDLRPECRFLAAGPARIILLTSALAESSQLAMLRSRGAEVHVLGGERVDLPRAFALLAEVGFRRVLVEGGGTLNFELLRLGLVDELQVYIAPLVFGGFAAPTLAAGEGLARESAIQLHLRNVEVIGDGGILAIYGLPV